MACSRNDRQPVTDLLGPTGSLAHARSLFDAQDTRARLWDAQCYESLQLPAQLTFSNTDPRFYESQ